MSGRDRTSAADRWAAVVCQDFAEAFGLPAVPVADFAPRSLLLRALFTRSRSTAGVARS
jgi:hypothetical protein